MLMEYAFFCQSIPHFKMLSYNVDPFTTKVKFVCKWYMIYR